MPINMDRVATIEKYNLLLLTESIAPLQWLWMSFCDTSKPRGFQFLGVIIVKARGAATAIREINRLGINPGGEIMTIELGNVIFDESKYANRLLTKEQAEEWCPLTPQEEIKL